MVSEEVRRDSLSLWEVISDKQVERMYVPFVALQQLAAASEVNELGEVKLREVITAGEQLQITAELVRMMRKAEGCKVINHYGPTEGHVVSHHEMSGRAAMWERLPPIGKPISNARLYVLDREQQIGPVGAIGELYIGGESLARGYLNRAELTAEKFVPDNHSGTEGARLYRTGDLARYRSSGDIEYIGRADGQVKVRGYRVELGEIEAAMREQEGVMEAAVIVREEERGDKRIVGYVGVGIEVGMKEKEVRRRLKERLPEYMVPQVIVVMERLPLTPSGKVDRRSLPAPDRAGHETEDSFVAPRNAIEATLSKIWAEVLGVENVGIYDNFFELGGDSILTIQVVSKANRAGLRLVPKQIFQQQTIAGLAPVIGTVPTIQSDQGIVTGAVPLTPIQRWFFDQNLPEPHHFNMGYLFELPQSIAPSVVREAVRRLVLHHDGLRMRYERNDSGWEQFNATADGAVPFACIDLSGLSDSKRTQEIELESTRLQQSLNLSEGPLLRVALFNFGGDKPDRLLVIIHHLAVDGVSWRILLEDLQTAIQQLSAARPVDLPPKTTSFKTWAERLVEHSNSQELRDELGYWLQIGESPVTALPVDHEDGLNLESSASVVSVSLTADETEALLREAPKANNLRVNDLLLTALAMSFQEWVGPQSLLLDVEGHGREDVIAGVDTSRTVGWFTSIYPMVLNAAEVEWTLNSIKEQVRAIPNNGIGYGLLRSLASKIEGTEKLRELPRAEVCYNYLGQFDQLFAGPSSWQMAREPIGPILSPKGKMSHLFYIVGAIFQGQLHMRFKYSSDCYNRSTVEALADSFGRALRSLIAHCRSVCEARDLAIDFPLAQLSHAELQEAFAQIEFEGE